MLERRWGSPQPPALRRLMTPTDRYAVGANTGNDMIDDRPAEPCAAWLNSTVIGIGLASLFSDVGHEMATTAMPALLATLHASPAVLGIIEGLADGLSSYAKLMSGLYSDRLRRRKPLAIVGYFITASGMASFAAATQWWHVLLGASAGGWGGACARPCEKSSWPRRQRRRLTAAPLGWSGRWIAPAP